MVIFFKDASVTTLVVKRTCRPKVWWSLGWVSQSWWCWEGRPKVGARPKKPQKTAGVWKISACGAGLVHQKNRILAVDKIKNGWYVPKNRPPNFVVCWFVGLLSCLFGLFCFFGARFAVWSKTFLFDWLFCRPNMCRPKVGDDWLVSVQTSQS